MSNMEAHRGKLVPLWLIGNTLEERCKSACERFKIELTGAHDTWEECLRDRGYRTLYIRGEGIYEIRDEELDAGGFSEADIDADGNINYFMLYYNGGGSFDEVLDSAIERIDNES